MLFAGLGRALALMRVLEVVEAVAAFAGSADLQVREELVVFLVTGSDYLHVDLLLVLDEEDYVAVFLVLFDFFVCGFANVRDSYSGSLETNKKKEISVYSVLMSLNLLKRVTRNRAIKIDNYQAILERFDCPRCFLNLHQTLSDSQNNIVGNILYFCWARNRLHYSY